MTYSIGTVVNRYEYDAWGNITAETEQVENPIKYAGEYYDEELGMYYLRARYYDPATGRFISQDPAMDGLNWYVYCGNNPVKYVDPFGLAPTVSAAAAMADHIYQNIPLSDSKDPQGNRALRTVAGWRLIDYYLEGSLKIGVYIPENDNWKNPSEYSLVFKGTTPTSLEDWQNNAQQYLGEYSSHLIDGMIFAGSFVNSKSNYEITFVGHSKGGGEAAVNAEFWNRNAIVFNPSVPDITWSLVDEGYVQPYVVRGDILNYYLGELPLGTSRYFKQQHNGWRPGVSTIDRINNHFMSSILAAILKGDYE